MSNAFDSHCHPQFSHYDSDRDEVIQRALMQDVSMICVGTNFETSKQAVELAKKYSGMWVTIGTHPNDIENFLMDDFAHLLNDDKEEKIIAIGEIGLDYYRTTTDDKQKKQKEVFEQFINLAYQYKKPLVLHCRDAASGSKGRSHKDAIEILKSAKDILYGGVAHSFTGTLEEAREYFNLGFYLGFNGIITFARQYDEVVIHTPIEKILLETDAPYLTPEPFRGKRNEPAYVKEVAKKIAELKDLSIEDVIRITAQNTMNLFKIEF